MSYDPADLGFSTSIIRIAISEEWWGRGLKMNEKDRYEIGSHHASLNFDLNHDLSLDVQIFKVNFWIVEFQEWMEWLIRNKGGMNRRDNGCPV